MISFSNVSKIYSDNSAALDGVSLTIEPREFVSIVGHSGAGKTTLLKLILAEERPTSGNITMERSRQRRRTFGRKQRRILISYTYPNRPIAST